MNFKVPRPLLSPPPVPNYSSGNELGSADIETWILISLICLVFLALIDASVDKCITRITITEEDESDLESDSNPMRSTDFTVSHLNDLNNHPWIMEVMERLKESLDERREQRLRALEEMMPIVGYERADEEESNSNDCVICLESFQNGESCRVFPAAADHGRGMEAAEPTINYSDF
ncbi:hypothetical protein ACFE04_023087 [Oxalis oulophora]